MKIQEQKSKINKEGVKFPKQTDILHKTEVNDTGNYFATLKDQIDQAELYEPSFQKAHRSI